MGLHNLEESGVLDMAAKRRGECPKCHEMCILTVHHIYPERHFKHMKGLNETILLCRDCHDKLERTIPFGIQEVTWYVPALRAFLKGEPIPSPEEFDEADVMMEG